jgi:hypothetical protein
MSGNRRNERQQTVETRAGVIADAVPDVAKGGAQRVYVGVRASGSAALEGNFIIAIGGDRFGVPPPRLAGLTRSFSLDFPVSMSKVHWTSLAMNGLPSCQVTPWRASTACSTSLRNLRNSTARPYPPLNRRKDSSVEQAD